jgi:signal transduction histidine kinase/CheY-like chemotaxis protein
VLLFLLLISLFYLNNRKIIHTLQEIQRRSDYQLRFQQIIADMATALAMAKDNDCFDTVLNDALAHLGELFSADRSYLFQFSADLARMSNTHEWCASGILPQRERLQDIEMADTPWWKEQLLTLGLVHIPEVSALPPEADPERREFERQGILSMVMMSMYGSHGTLIGFFGFDSVVALRHWRDDELAMLQGIAAIFGAAIERRRIEQSLLLAQEELQRNERLLSDAEMLARIGGWEYQVATGKMYWTRGLFALHRFEDDGSLDCIQRSIECYRPEDRGHIMEAFQRCMSAGEAYDLVVPFTNAQQEARWIRTKTAPLVVNGEVVRVIGIVMDVTELKQNEIDLQKALERAEALTSAAEAANLAKNRFLATMSHELRTPLNGILGMAQLLLAGERSEGRIEEYSRTILNSGEMLLRLLNDILDLSRIEAGRLSLEIGVVQPLEILHECETLFSVAAASKGLTLKSHWRGGQTCCYQGDPQRIRQMLSNLVSNAVKFTSQGSVVIEGQQLLDVTGVSQLEFAVIDSGIGIDAMQQELLFQHFTQLDNSTTRQFGGSGLGLSIVRQLAQLMGGEAGVDSEIGRGARFWFRLPLPLIISAEVEDALPPPGQLPRLAGCVLVVEDNRINQRVITALLQSLGLESRVVGDGEEAVAALATPALAEAFILVLMDLQMPRLDGYGATQQIRQIEQQQLRRRLPIIALTADAFPADRQRALASGMDDYLAKPVNVQQLAALLVRWLPLPPDATIDSAAPQPQRAGVDWALWHEQANALLPLLAQSRFVAIDRFGKLEAAMVATPIAAELAKLRPALQAFRFSEVHRELSRLIAQTSEKGAV